MTSLATLPGFLTHFIAGIALVWLGRLGLLPHHPAG